MEYWCRTEVPFWARTAFISIIIVSAMSFSTVIALNSPVLSRDSTHSPLFLVIVLPAFGIAVTALIGLLLIESGGNWLPARLLRSAPLQ